MGDDRRDELELPSAKRARVNAGGPLALYGAQFATALQHYFSQSNNETQLEALLSDAVVWHDSLLPLHATCLTGTKQLRALRSLLLGAFPDLRMEVDPERVTAGEQGLVLGYWRAEGTHKGALGPSLLPSGNTASFEGSFVVRTQQRGQQDEQPQPEKAQEQQQQQGDGATAAKAADGGAKADQAGEFLGVEVWWSWDPIFLFRQLGWKEGAAQPAGEAGADVAGDAGTTAGDLAAAEAALTAVDGATETAAAARAACATEDEAVAAAEAAVAEAAAAAERLAAGGGSLAEVHAANRRVVEMYFHTYNTGHFRVLDHIVHPDYKYDGLLDLGGRVGREGMVAMMSGWRLALPDLAIGHELFAAMGTDRVTFRWVIRGTHTAPAALLGVATSGKRLLVKGVTTLTLAGGRIVRKISHANAAYTLQQLGTATHPQLPRLA